MATIFDAKKSISKLTLAKSPRMTLTSSNRHDLTIPILSDKRSSLSPDLKHQQPLNTQRHFASIAKRFYCKLISKHSIFIVCTS